MRRKNLRIILADNNRLFIDSLKLVIESRKLNIKIVDTAQDSFEAVKRVEKERPDIILVDIDLPGMNGIDMLKAIRSNAPDTRIVVLTTNTDAYNIEESLKNGVCGYILKDIALTELMALLPPINDKTIILSRELIAMGVSFKNKLHAKQKTRDNLHSLQPVFSDHERKLMNYVIQGFSNREIAEKMYLAEQTVKNYLSFIYTKLGVHKRSQAIQKLKALFSGFQ